MKKYESFHYWVKENYNSDKVLLELGSGIGTNILLEKFKVYSVEDNPKFLNLYPTNYIHAPIVNYQGYRWYDRKVIESMIPDNYDVFIIDGPIGTIGRHGLLKNLDLFKKDIVWLVDDVNRQAELNLLKELSKILKKEYTIFNQSQKQFGILH